MPGLFGVVAKKPVLSERDLQSMARRMADSMRRLPWLQVEMWTSKDFCGGRVHLGVLNPSPQPLVTTDRASRVWFDGQLYARSGDEGITPTAEHISELVSGSGSDLAEVDGVFALACFNEEKGELVLANDRLGFRPLYYTETEDWFAYAAEVKALLAVRDTLPDLDEISLRQFFALDHMMGERTWWTGIELIPPASVWRVSRQGCTTHQYWSFEDIRVDPVGKDDAYTQFAQLWSEDVRRHSKPGEMPVMLSGGLDSRLLVAELLDQEADVVGITYGDEQSPEVVLSRIVAKTARIEHRLCWWNTRNWWHRREEAIWQTDGLVNCNHLHPAIAMDELRTVGNCYSPMNILGDLLFGGSHLDRSLSSDWRESPEKLFEGRWMRLAENPFFKREEVLSVSMDDARRYAHGPSSDCFHLRQRYRRYVLHSPGCVSSYCETTFPGLRYELLQLFLGSLSEEARIKHKFYNRFLISRHPKFFGDIVWQPTGRGLAESLPTRVLRSLRARVRLLMGKRARQKLPPSNQWFVDYPACLQQSRVREQLLKEDLLVDVFLHGAAREALKNSHASPLRVETIMSILTFETYLRHVAGMPGFSHLLLDRSRQPLVVAGSF